MQDRSQLEHLDWNSLIKDFKVEGENVYSDVSIVRKLREVNQDCRTVPDRAEQVQPVQEPQSARRFLVKGDWVYPSENS